MIEIKSGDYIVHVTGDMECITEQELVRCKDCKWYYRGGATCMYWDGANAMFGDDFCSRAERREDANI